VLRPTRRKMPLRQDLVDRRATSPSNPTQSRKTSNATIPEITSSSHALTGEALRIFRSMRCAVVAHKILFDPRTIRRGEMKDVTAMVGEAMLSQADEVIG
jgi:hypothetical protein